MSASREATAARAIVLTGPAVGLVGIYLLLAPATAASTEYQLNPRVEVAAGYDDNANLASVEADKIATADFLADARLELVARESNWEWLAVPEVRGTWYPGHSGLNSDGQFLYLKAERTGPRYALSLSAYGSSQSLVANYLPTANIGSGLGVSEPGTTLGVPSSIRQNLWDFRPSYTLAMSPLTSLELNLDYTGATYSQQLQGGYTNYDNVTGSAGLLLKATLTGSLTLRAIGGGFRADSGANSSTYGAEAQWDGRLSETKQYYLRAGAVRVEVSGTVPTQAGSSTSTQVSGGAGTHWTYTLTEVFVDLTRDVEPTSLGYLVNRNELRLRLARRFTPRLAGFLGARSIYDDPVRGSTASTVQAQRYNYGTAGFEWRVKKEFSLIGAYEFTASRYGGPLAQANSVHVSLVYEPYRPETGPAITVGY